MWNIDVITLPPVTHPTLKYKPEGCLLKVDFVNLSRICSASKSMLLCSFVCHHVENETLSTKFAKSNQFGTLVTVLNSSKVNHTYFLML